MVAWTALQFPWIQRPVSEKQRAQALYREMPPRPEGMDEEALKEILPIFGLANGYGYSPDTDYRKYQPISFIWALD